MTVSAKIDRALKREMDHLGVSPSEVIQRALAAEVLARRKKRALEKLDEVKASLGKVAKEAWVRAVRERRDSH